jgi:hypothetical protein
MEENKEYIYNIAKRIKEKLGIEEDIIDDLLKNINFDKLSDEKKSLIDNLIDADDKLNLFKDKIKTDKVKKNFDGLKTNLGKLQILILIKSLKKSESCDDILDSFIKILNTNVNSMNQIAENNIIQKGGFNKNINTNYLNKYIKYKIKYLQLKHNILI